MRLCGVIWQALHTITDTAMQARPGIGVPGQTCMLDLEGQLLASQTLVMSGLPMFGEKIAVG